MTINGIITTPKLIIFLDTTWVWGSEPCPDLYLILFILTPLVFSFWSHSQCSSFASELQDLTVWISVWYKSQFYDMTYDFDILLPGQWHCLDARNVNYQECCQVFIDWTMNIWQHWLIWQRIRKKDVNKQYWAELTLDEKIEIIVKEWTRHVSRFKVGGTVTCWCILYTRGQRLHSSSI